jgi:hypothetical protein
MKFYYATGTLALKFILTAMIITKPVFFYEEFYGLLLRNSERFVCVLVKK